MKSLKGFIILIFIVALTVQFITPAFFVEKAHAAGTNLIANPSMETVVNNAPQSWSSNNWGTNTAQFSLVGGHTGATAARTDVTAYTNGDAKWYAAPVSVTAGSTYLYEEYYRSNISTEAVIQYTRADGTNFYEWLGFMPAASAWTQKQFTITVPTGAVSFSMFHVVAATGWLEIDDVSMSEQVVTPPVVEAGNMVPNPSMEQGTSMPDGWNQNNWGTNSAQFSYQATGRTGKSVKTTVTTYTDGDAKWYFSPIAVTAGKTYTYRHYYQSTAKSEVVIQYTNAAGTTSYEYVKGLTAASTWTELTFDIAVPAGATKVSVFHVLANTGELSIDDVFMAEKTVATPPPTNGNPILNPSLETASGTQPANWSSDKWGTNTTSFTYENTGHTGTKSVKTSITSYTDGDAKWSFKPVAVTGGNQYRFTVWYKTNTIPHAVVMHNHADGSVSYDEMPIPQPSEGASSAWQQYTNTFSAPANAVSSTVFFLVKNVGWVQIDDAEIAPYQEVGFSRPLVTLTFDDGHEDNATTALPIMQQYGFLSTQCYATTFIEDAPVVQTAINDVLAFKNAGHEICSHTVTHPFLTQLSATDVQYELSHSQQYLQSITGMPIKDFASPYGDYNASVNAAVDDYYQSHRTVNAGYNSKDNFNRYEVKVQNMLSTTTLAEFQGWLNHAKATNTWLVLVYHRVANDPGDYDTYQSDFAAQMQALANSGMTVKTYDAALQEVLSQL